jgi:hypothetical protein
LAPIRKSATAENKSKLFVVLFFKGDFFASTVVGSRYSLFLDLKASEQESNGLEQKTFRVVLFRVRHVAAIFYSLSDISTFFSQNFFSSFHFQTYVF